MMKIFIELPSWLGDAVMTSPTIENLVNFFVDVEITLMGSLVAIEALQEHPKVIKTYVLDKNYFNLYKTVKSLDEFDLFLSFRSSFRSRFLKFWMPSKRKYQFKKAKFIKGHQVEKYNYFVNESLNINTIPGKLKLHFEARGKVKNKKLLGINPGASYGSSKRWYPEEFANVACELSNEYDIIIFGGPDEKDIAQDIERCLIEKDVYNYQNLAAKTSIKELIVQISNLDLCITGDSGPMHLAAALQIPSITIFGPTRDNETSQWKNEKSLIVKKNLDCQPCMKRHCPLDHHNCMKLIKAEEVIKAVATFN